jgi:hypothetical protein
VLAFVESFPSVAPFVAYERKPCGSYKNSRAWGAGEPARAEMRRSGSSIRTHSLTSSSRRCLAAEGLRAEGDVGGSGGAGRSAADLSEGRERERAATRVRWRAANRRRWRAVNRGRRNAVLCVGRKEVIWLGNLDVGESNERGKSQAENVNAG